ncbi:hypothetical protein AB1Y20_012364 [Prymnesium parvum]|uniref:Uncharacterized protein n=1 Tax=Prymnesium parvum TaxID=97485 RepID=A0AB34IPC3_PRYPA
MRLERALTKPHSSIAVVPWLLTDGSPPLDARLLDLSARLRAAGASALLLSADLRHLSLLVDEQSSAAGQFPSACPVIYAPPPSPPPHAPPPRGVAAVLRRGEGEGEGVVRLLQTAAEVEALCGGGVVVATGEAAAAARRRRGGGEGGALVVAELQLEEMRGTSVAELREAGCAAVCVRFDVAAWPVEPEELLPMLLSKRSSAFGSYGVNIGFGTFQSDQYWINKKMKAAKELNQKRSAPPDAE